MMMMMPGITNYSIHQFIVIIAVSFSLGRLSHSAPLLVLGDGESITTESISTTSSPTTVIPPALIALPALKKNITYVAGPDQLTLLMDKGAFRYGFDTDNQFKVERRWPNGTVAGYYGFIGADGVPVRVKYGAVDQLGFSAIHEVVPHTFPPKSSSTTSRMTESSIISTTEKASSTTSAPESANDRDTQKLSDEYLDEERNSISVNAADFNSLMDNYMPSKKFNFPKIELNHVRRILRSAKPEHSFNLPEAKPLAAPTTIQEDRHLIIDRDHPGEPAIIYSDPSRRRYIKKTVGIQFRLQKDNESS